MERNDYIENKKPSIYFCWFIDKYEKPIKGTVYSDSPYNTKCGNITDAFKHSLLQIQDFSPRSDR